MSSKFLPVFVQDARLFNAELVEPVRERRAGLRQVLELCRNYRIAAIGQLLLLGDADAFRVDLYKSGRAYLYFLEGADEAQLITSRAVPFFDALGARDFEGAREIARRSRRTWAPGVEYEEDFLYMDFLMGHFFRDLSEAAAAELLQRYERALQGTEDIRLEVCHALLARQGEHLDAALDRMMDEREARQARLLEKGSLSEEMWATECQVSIEGLALVALAERVGVPMRSDHLFIPSLARDGELPEEPPDAWMDPGD
ncbi:Imm49 family immunity protein [Archangium sp.]|uniref:Imm49 family immunity protein n=1 Tax=Archangium sp. TaxID=1872627 RepID=UPI002D352F9D|nr:Imm49 family immunity protein [Archangium sp.]HYO57922.1 Imm49 family immunity protein [Archangium sp.]